MSDAIRTRLLSAYADEHRDHLAALRAALAAQGAVDLEDSYRHAHSLKGAARAIDLPAVVDLAHGLESLLDAWWQGRAVPDAGMTARAQAALDAIEDLSAAALAGQPVPATHAALGRLAEGLRGMGLAAPHMPAAAPPPAPCAPAPVAGTLRVEAGTADHLAVSTTQLLSELDRHRAGEAALRALGESIGAIAARTPPAVRDEVARLRLRFAEAMRALDERDWAVGRAAEAVAADVARLRLVAAEGTLGGFGPMLRALAADQGKEIRYAAHGLATQADREVLAVLGEAVMHLLRNAVAHGIEPPEERRAAGKEEAGRLTLMVGAVGPRLEVRVTDDGAGIATARLVAEAVARGLLDAGQAERADVQRLTQLVFQPGLTTAGSLDTTAGRGMGMAIVRRLVDRLQGEVMLRSTTGLGTEVILSVPVTILVQRIALLRVRGQMFGLPALALTRLVHLSEADVVRVDGGMAAVVDGAEVALADLGVLLALPGEPDVRHGLCTAVIRTAGRSLGLVVDSVTEVRDLPVTPLEDSWTAGGRLAGTVTLGGGRLVLVLSPGGLAARGAAAAFTLPEGGAAPAPLVLVVDDSPTIRALERSLLEAHAFRVAVAADGCEALERMVVCRPSVVVSDVEMPCLDGFGLLAAMRADPRLAAVPVVMLSSRSGEADRHRAQALGAAGFLSKSGFDQQRFLSVIKEVIA